MRDEIKEKNLLFILQTAIKVKLFAVFAKGRVVNIYSLLIDAEK